VVGKLKKSIIFIKKTMAILYRHIRLDKNEPFYIGIGKTEKRAYFIHNRNKFWENIVSKTDYEVEILFDDLSWSEACEKEKEFIELYGRKDIGTGILVNMTNGGDGQLGNKFNVGRKHSEESKRKMSEKSKNRILDEDTIKKMKEKMRLAKLGKKRPERTLEHRIKLSIVQKGKPKSPEARKNMSLAHIGKKPNNMKKVLINGVVYESLTYVAKEFGIQHQTVTKRIKSKRRKFINWSFYNN
jgi:hypothetical protein